MIHICFLLTLSYCIFAYDNLTRVSNLSNPSNGSNTLNMLNVLNMTDTLNVCNQMQNNKININQHEDTNSNDEVINILRKNYYEWHLDADDDYDIVDEYDMYFNDYHNWY